MQDHELKKLLEETCPVRPGQEARAWNSLKDRLYPQAKTGLRWSWLYLPTWRGAAFGLAAVGILALVGNSVFTGNRSISFASANSESPGIFATTFYSARAQAQVVWLNGLDPASDAPTYLDPTTVLTAKPAANDPHGL